jgi:hypothetical protein
MRLASLLVAAAVMAVVLAAPLASPAQDTKPEIKDGDSVKTILERYTGKRVGLVMASGPEISGVVVKVGERVVHIGELQGRELFDAAVSLDRINGVVVRTRAR